ncbi:MAG TPA: thioester reductase domain-containing protein [Nocardia sp.]|uniref:thioester reductase domain-containing protein n=1 Tax=Nocardia sp. TaxID=1821 RepID=UPI002B4AC04A|nr:thioester reductase domain-containing protein [Nocardia sp.]HLS75778.1 thioester reductase domain-containing protein [Nocardia sp.]
MTDSTRPALGHRPGSAAADPDPAHAVSGNQRRDVDRRSRAEAIERGGTGLDIAALLARTGVGGGAPSAAAVAGSATDSPSASALSGPAAADPPDLPPPDLPTLTAAITALANRFSTSPLEEDTDFFDAGGTSLAAVEFVSALARELDVHLDLDTVFFDARPRRLAERWLAHRPAVPEPPATTGVAAGSRPAAVAPVACVPAADLAAPSGAPPGEPVPGTPGATDDLAQLFADLSAADRLPLVTPAERVAPEHILLTGATGFLGSHLLLDLLRHSDAHVVCLVRAEDDEAARQRLIEALGRYALPASREVLRRVTPLAGDLREPRLGLSGPAWEALATQVDSIVNAAAAVDFLRGYPSLRRTNVLGPLTLAELACAGGSTPIHHISSLAVFNGVEAPSLGEDDPTAPVATLPIGYDRSKWAAEAILRRAREHGLTVTVLRPGGIGTHPETGAHNPRDLNSGITAALLRFRTVPGFRCLNGASVDWVSRVAAEIVLRPQAWGHTYHLTAEPATLDQIVAGTALGGLGVRVQHWQSWCEDVVRAIREEPAPELESLAQVLQSPVARRQLAAMVNVPPSRADRTRAFVAAHGLPAPAVAARGRTVAATAGLRSPSGEPYLRFDETLSGLVGPVGGVADIPCDARLTLSAADSAQAFTARILDVSGTVSCPALHDEPLTVSGTAAVRPHDGLPPRGESRHPLMRYDLTLRAPDGRTWWLTGHKFAAARRRFVRQLGTQLVEIGAEGAPAAWSGEIAVPMHTYLSDQIDGIRVDPHLPERQQRLAKLLWLSWFGGQLGVGVLEPMLRVGVDLLDLRRALREEGRR